MPLRKRSTPTRPARALRYIVVSIVLCQADDGSLQVAAIQGADPLTMASLAKVLGEAQQQVLMQMAEGAAEQR